MDINSQKRTLILEILKRHTVKHTTKRCTKSCRTQDAARSLTTLTKIGTLHVANGWRGLSIEPPLSEILQKTVWRPSTRKSCKLWIGMHPSTRSFAICWLSSTGCTLCDHRAMKALLKAPVVRNLTTCEEKYHATLTPYAFSIILKEIRKANDLDALGQHSDPEVSAENCSCTLTRAIMLPCILVLLT